MVPPVAQVNEPKKPIEYNEPDLKVERSGTFLQQSFDPSVIELPHGFKGHDIISIYKKLDKVIPSKNEYETTKSYQEKLRSLKNNDIYAFKIYALSDYNADKQILTVELKSELLFESPREGTSFILHEEENSLGTYPATNAFGAKVSVGKYSNVYYGITLTNGNVFGKKKEYKRIFKNDFKMASEIAKQSRSGLNFLLICKPDKRDNYFTYSRDNYSEPSFSVPIERTKKWNYVYVKLLELWIFNEETGKVFKRFKLEI